MNCIHLSHDVCEPCLNDLRLAAGQDIVNKPPHYISATVEAIDVIEAFSLNFHLGNVVKYVLRHEKKNGLEDLQKAQWYLSREIERRKKTLG